MKKIIVLFISVLLLLAQGCSGGNIYLPESPFGSSSFSMYGHSPERSFYEKTIIPDTIRVKWISEVSGSFASTSLTCYENYIFVPDLSGKLFVFDTKTGKESGYLKFKGELCSAPLINQFKLVFQVNKKNESKSEIINFDFHVGKTLNSIEINGNIKTELQKQGNDIFCVTEQGEAFRFFPNLEIAWSFKTNKFVHSSPVLYNNALIFGNDKGEVISLNVKDGSLNYRKKTGSAIQAGLTAADGKIYTADDSGNVLCLNASDGKMLWKTETGVKNTITPAIDSTDLYTGNLKGEIFKLEKKTGKILWKIVTDGIINATPLIFENYLIQPDFNRKLYFIDKQTGKITRTMTFESRMKMTPVFYNNTLYAGVDFGKIYAFEFVGK